MPGKLSRLDLRRNIFSAPQGSPGPRGPNNLIILSEPIVDREARKSWPSYNLNNAYIQRLWTYWCELITETNLCQSHLDSRNGNRPFRPGLVPLKRTNDVENLMHLQQIQSASVQEGTFYELWPQIVCHLFEGNFIQVRSFCVSQRPTWPMVVEAILQILHLSNNLRSPVDAFVAFRSGPSPTESTTTFLKRLNEAFQRMPTRERVEREVECTIEYTSQTHAGMDRDALIQNNEAYPLHNALSNAWLIAHSQQGYMSKLLSRLLDSQLIPSFTDPLRPKITSVAQGSDVPLPSMKLDDSVMTANFTGCARSKQNEWNYTILRI